MRAANVMSSMFTIALVLLVLGGVTVLAILYRLRQAHTKLIGRVQRRYRQLCEKVRFFSERLGLIQAHALDYINSMSPEGSRAMYQLQQLIATQKKLVDELEDWVQSEDTVTLAEADRVLYEMLFSPDDSAAAHVSGVVRTKLDGWEIRFEQLLQLVGRDIADASRSARELGVARRRDRKSTQTSLKLAGILAAETGEPDER